jgi:1-acylglycerone phosphate reductase
MASSKSVLITGCSSGIGHALAREFKSQGLRVFATARKTESIADLAALGIETLPLEATSSESIEALKAEIVSRTGGKLDFLVNNAGRNYTVPALEVEMHEIEATFAVNVFAVMRMTQAFAPLLIEAQGTIAMIGSLAGEMPYVFGSVYCASKAALHGYTDTLRLELKPFKVRVVNVVTGGVKSQIARTVRTLRSDSIYLPVEKDYERRLTHSQSLGMDTDKYAKSVVSQLTGWRQKQTIWEGEFCMSLRPRKVMLLMFYCRLQVLARLVCYRLHAQVCHCTYLACTPLVGCKD